jgi:hypothetical protein
VNAISIYEKTLGFDSGFPGEFNGAFPLARRTAVSQNFATAEGFYACDTRIGS